MLTVNLKKKVHRKQWEALWTAAAVISAAGVCLEKDEFSIPFGNGQQGYYITGVSSIFNWDSNEEGMGQLPNSGSAGTFGAGCNMELHPMGPTGTASAGTVNGLTTTLTLPRDLRGYRIRITGDVTQPTNKGHERIIASNTIGANSVITFQDPLPQVANSTTVFALVTGRLWLYVPGATSGFNYFDFATGAWTSRSVASGPAITANEGQLIGSSARETVMEQGYANGPNTTNTLVDASRNWNLVYPSMGAIPDQVANYWARSLVYIFSGTGVGQYRYVVSNTATTLTVDANWTTIPDATSQYEIIAGWSDVASAGSTTAITAGSGTPWATNQWTNYQVRCVAGTGAGQVAIITSNTTSVLSFSAVGTAFDATSRYVIENNDDTLYFLGGAAVTLFKYTIAGNTWSTLAPGAARAAAPSTGASGSFIGSVRDPLWIGVGTTTGGPNGPKQNGRYIYSFRGGAVSTLDIYDIVANTWVSGWAYAGASNETFTTGSSFANMDGCIYAQKDATGRCFKLDIRKNELVPLGTNAAAQGAAVAGSRLIVDKYYDNTNGKFLRWVYWVMNTSQQMFRLLEI